MNLEHKKKNCGGFCRKAPFFALFFVLAHAALGYVVYLLWNALVPELFHGPLITYLQSIGLLILSRILLRGGGCHGRHHGPWGRGPWAHRWAHLSEEERAKLRAEIEKRCGTGCLDEESVKKA